MTLIAAYIRVSGPSQVHGEGFRRQDETITKFCEQQGLFYTMAYVEYGVTGDSSFDEREALGQLEIDLANRDCPMTVVIEHPDRMARGVMAAMTILEGMNTVKATVLCACDGQRWTIDTKDPEAMLFWGIRTLFAQYDKMRIMAKMNAGKAAMRAQGLSNFVGPAAFGTRMMPRSRAKNPYEVYMREKAIVDQVRKMEKLGPNKISVALNEVGFTTRHGKRWSPMNVSRLLSKIRRREGRAHKIIPRMKRKVIQH